VDTLRILDGGKIPAVLLNHVFKSERIDGIFFIVADDSDHTGGVVGSTLNFRNISLDRLLDTLTGVQDNLSVFGVTFLTDLNHDSPTGRYHVSRTTSSNGCRGVETTIPA
jgi:hypothetical protein